jgi:hypothetical protein
VHHPLPYRVRAYGPTGRIRGTFSTTAGAERWGRAVKADRDRGNFIDPRLSRVRVADFARRWFAALDVEDKTLEDYESLWRTHVAPGWGKVALRDGLPLDVRTWTKELREGGLSTSRIRKAHIVLNQIMVAAAEQRYIQAAPPLRLRLKGNAQDGPGPVRALYPDEVARLAIAIRNKEIVGKYADLRFDVWVVAGFRHESEIW